MPKFLFGYHGGSAPESPDDQAKVLAAWMAWNEGHGPDFIDPGEPVGQSNTVSASGIAPDGGPNPLTGYAIVKADDLAAATAIAKGCPILEDGGTVEVAQIHEM